MATNRNWFKRLFRLDFDDQFDAALDLIEVQEIAIVDVHDRVDGVQEAVKVVTGRVDTVEGKLAALKTFDFFGRTVVAQFDYEKSIVGDTSITVSIDNVAAQAFLRFGSARVVDTIDAVWFISKTGVPIGNDFGDVLHPAAQRRDVQDFLYMTSEKQGDEPLDIIIPDHTHDNYISQDELDAEIKAREEGDEDTLDDAKKYTDKAIEGIDFPAGTIVSDTAPEKPEAGATWYDTVRLELFVFADGGWVPSSPLGARVDAGEALQAQILSRVEAGEAKQEVLESSSFKTSGDNTVDTTWRVKSGSKTIISGAEEGKVKIYHLAEPTDGDHAATRSYADGKVSRSGSNDLSGDSWLVRQDNEDGNYRTLIHGDGGQLGLYNLKDPSDSHHAVPRSYVDEKVDAKLDLAGGTNSKMTGNLYMGGNKIAGLKAPELDTDAANKIYVDTAVAGVASQGGPTSKYDGNRFNVSGTSTKQLNENEVMFLQGETTVTHLGTIDTIGLPEDEFDWDGCAKSGVVKVMNGAELAGYFQVFDIVKNEGRNVLLRVNLISFGDGVEVSYESGTPCYFQGVFFA